MAEVLDAATRAPRSALAEEADAVDEQGDTPLLPQDAAPVDPAVLVGSAWESAPDKVLGAVEGLLAPLDGPTDEDEEQIDPDAPDPTLDVAPGVVGLPTPEGAPSLGDVVASAVGATGEDTPAQADSPDRSIIMTAPRDETLHVSLWDGDRAEMDPNAPGEADKPEGPPGERTPSFNSEDNATLLAIAGQDNRDTGGRQQALLVFDYRLANATKGGKMGKPTKAQQAAADELRPLLLPTEPDVAPDEPDPVHLAAGTAEDPYACSCGKNPGSLNKLGSHLGLVGDEDAMAHLAGYTASLKLPTPDVPPVEAELDPEVAAEFIELGASGDGSAHLSAEAEQAMAAELNAAMGSDDVEVTIEAAQPWTSDHIDAIIEVQSPGESAPPKRDPMDVADDVRTSLATGAAGYMSGQHASYRIIVVHADGWAHEALYSDAALPPALTDDLLEHCGFLPSPLDSDSPADPPPSTPAAEPVDQGMLTAQRSPARVLAPQHLETPTRVQMARLTTECGSCTTKIEPGQMMGHRDGLGWCHLNHDD